MIRLQHPLKRQDLQDRKPRTIRLSLRMRHHMASHRCSRLWMSPCLIRMVYQLFYHLHYHQTFKRNSIRSRLNVAAPIQIPRLRHLTAGVNFLKFLMSHRRTTKFPRVPLASGQRLSTRNPLSPKTRTIAMIPSQVCLSSSSTPLRRLKTPSKVSSPTQPKRKLQMRRKSTKINRRFAQYRYNRNLWTVQHQSQRLYQRQPRAELSFLQVRQRHQFQPSRLQKSDLEVRMMLDKYLPSDQERHRCKIGPSRRKSKSSCPPWLPTNQALREAKRLFPPPARTSKQ